MADSLREQLLKSGIVKQARKSKPQGKKGRQRQSRKQEPASDMDLARAYAIRARAEAQERKRAKADAEAEAKARKERKRRLQKTLDGKVLNKADAEYVRHFEYGGRIRRVHVDEAQLRLLNQGRLGVVQVSGRYVLATADVIRQVAAFAPDHVALLIDPDAPRDDDDGVPDDLVW